MSNPDTEDLNWLDEIADEYANRLRLGELPSIESYVKQRPALEAEIRDMLGVAGAIESAQRLDSRHVVTSGKQFPTIETYQILREIGRGGMGIVYEAQHEILGRKVALKVLAPHLARDSKSVGRFRQEARAAGKLQHSNIVPIYEVSNEQSSTLHFTMPLIHGMGIDRVIHLLRTSENFEWTLWDESDKEVGSSTQRNGSNRHLSNLSVSLDELKNSRDSSSSNPPVKAEYFRLVAKIGQQVAEALAYAHQNGILHRDIKPSNILLDSDGTAWISDFGLAKDLEENPTITTDLAGTLRYMAPERFSGRFDARSDVYGLGLVLYELVTLQPAFDCDDRAKLLDAIRNNPISEARRLEPRIPSDLNTIISKAAAQLPEERYSTAAELADDLHRYLTFQPIRAKSIGSLERSRKWIRRHPSAATLIGVALLTALSTTVLWRKAEISRLHESIARKNAERLIYSRDIAMANFEYRSQKFDRSREILEGCQPENRNWEWHYMRNRLNLAAWSSPKLGRIVSTVAVSPDGKYVAAGFGSWRSNSASPVVVWDTHANTTAFELVGHPACHITSAEFSRDGSLLMTSGIVWDREADGEFGGVRVWNTKDGTLLLALEGVNSEIARISPDERSLLVGDLNAVVTQYSIDVGRKVREFKGSLGMIFDIEFSQDGARMAASARDGSLCVWDLESGTMQNRVTKLVDPRIVSWSPNSDEKLEVVSYSGTRYTFDTRHNQLNLVHQSLNPTLKAMKHSPDGTLVASSLLGVGIEIESAKRNSVIRSINAHGGNIQAVAFDGSGRRLVTGGIDGFVHLWDLSRPDPETISTEIRSGRVSDIAYSPNGQFVAFAITLNRERSKSASGKPRIEIRNSSNMQLVRELTGHSDWLTSVAYRSDGELLLTGSEDKTVRVWNVGTGLQACQFEGHTSTVTDVAFLTHQDYAISGDDRGKVCVWNYHDGIASHQWELNNKVIAIAYLSKQRLAIVATDRGEISFWDPNKGICVRKHLLYPNLQAIALSPNEQLIAVGNNGPIIPVWRIDDLLAGSAKPHLELQGHSDDTASLDFSPDNKRLISGSRGSSIPLFDVEWGQELLRLDHISAVSSLVRFRPDGNEILRSLYGRISRWGIIDSYCNEVDKLNAALSWHKSRASWAEIENEFVAAAKQYTELMRLQPENSDHLHSRAKAYLFSGRWKSAINDYLKLTESSMSVIENCYLARAHLRNNDIDAYQKSCHSLVEWARESKSVSNLNSYLWTCALSNKAQDELQVALKSFEAELLKVKDPYPDFYTTLALGCFRAQRYHDAIRYSDQSLNRKTGALNPDDWLILALSVASLQQGMEDRSVEVFDMAIGKSKLKSPEEYLALLSRWRENQTDRIFAGATPETYAVQRMNIDIPILTDELAAIGVFSK